jgi:hypothetical protein
MTGNMSEESTLALSEQSTTGRSDERMASECVCSRSVSWSKQPPSVVETLVWNNCGLTREGKAQGKAATRAMRYQYPGLPKFTYFDSDDEAAVAEQAAKEARQLTLRTLEAAQQISPDDPSIYIGPCTTRRKSRGSAGEYTPCNTSSVLSAAASAATARITARRCSSGEISPCASRKTRAPSMATVATFASRWISHTPVLAKRSSVDTPMSLLIQRHDSIKDAYKHGRFGAAISGAGTFMPGMGRVGPQPMTVA